MRLMEGARWENISDQAKDLVKSLLKVDPEERLSCEETLDHPWFRESPAVVDAALMLMKEGSAPLKDGLRRRGSGLKAED